MSPLCHHHSTLDRPRHTHAAKGDQLKWTRSQRLRNLAEISLEVELRGQPKTPVYQLIAAEAAQMHDPGVLVSAIAKHFRIDYNTAAKALGWFRQR